MLASVPVVAEFGWTDSDLLKRVAKACEGIQAELKGLREELKLRGEKK